MRFTDLVHPANLRAAMEAKLVNVRDSGDGQKIYNYSDLAMFTPGAWDNPAVRQCRGLIVDPDGDVVARPWAKFFNHGQVEAGDLDMAASVEVTDKLDGSLGILHKAQDGTPRVASRGSFASEQAIHATAVLRDRYRALDWPAHITPLVEIVYPSNRIVCDYGNLDDLILLGSVDIDTGAYYGPIDTQRWIAWMGPVADVMPYTSLRDALAAPPRPGKEGLCVRYLGAPHIVKIKQEDYVRLHKIVTGLSERKVWQHMVDGGTLDDFLAQGIPDELVPWTREVWSRLAGEADAIANDAQDEHERIIATLDPEHTRGEYAHHAKGSSLTPHLFTILDGRDPRPKILNGLKPAGDTRAKTYSEDVA